jgi:hypothetical protein
VLLKNGCDPAHQDPLGQDLNWYRPAEADHEISQHLHCHQLSRGQLRKRLQLLR